MASSYSGLSVVPASSCFSSVAWTSGGSSSRSRFTSFIHSGTLAGELSTIRLASPHGWPMAYSIPSIPPHEWPNTWTRSRPSASRTAWTSSTYSSGVHMEVWCGSATAEFPQPSWS
jgi:hypothetical protein